MKRGKPKADPLFGMTEQQTPLSKPNRLGRSYRASQQITSQIDPGQQLDFKTPTRMSRPRSGVFHSGSPQNDSDFQQDIIWDATSPSPRRLGKRGRRQRAHVVDISEIVNKIAPKHGRPETAESTLQQWFGDSATIPCTPDVQVSKPKRSPRLNGVNDLLKLAKQFDFMFHQDEEEEKEERGHQSDLLSQDIVHHNTDPAAVAKTVVWTDLQMDDDLDFLFDGPTQHMKSSSLCSSSAADVKGTLNNDGFEDDWEDDDLLNDSLLLEMTPNPHKFTSPKYCSTQKPPRCERPASRGDQSSAGSVYATSDIQQNQSLSSRADAYEWTQPVKSDLQEPAHISSSIKAKKATEFNQNQSSSSDTCSSSKVAGDNLLPSDPVWDDPADDHLLCELCEDLENQIQKEGLTSTGRTDGPQRAALQPAKRIFVSPTGSSLASAFFSKVPAAVTGENGLRSASTGRSQGSQFAFKKPLLDVRRQRFSRRSSRRWRGADSGCSLLRTRDLPPEEPIQNSHPESRAVLLLLLNLNQPDLSAHSWTAAQKLPVLNL
ncbi:ewing's tumor-associated antigen 1 isoform X1 [Takifugu rubripes]|uniref:ewing's tumor-associated antigen 1 isoform X1 n=1 Tax=Takifugu rubripes TaxID=31033 RepID=UPI001145E8F6|nr:uncharacterized protein LOC105417657 isoform X1 [Takifugu rubripes]